MTKVSNDPLVKLVMQLPPFEREIVVGAVKAHVCKSVPMEEALEDAKLLIERHRAGETLRLNDLPAGWLVDLSLQAQSVQS
ncbi:hypothetical protein NM680_19965 [Paracoccus sp. PS-1]|jgi:hypothetical protein|uniref:hypothetical protein n=1 Tax=unclassified Paracoccus (in: a-proteobacteria) TaxID=2688777 RepID=UPI00258A1451|nr:MULTISPECIES: hypothetical protein [unclassified Paracoccus (in: a-proteobacteria)]MDQ7264071.1 hypothetical protein [Paracoccus sp. PS1]